MEKATHDPAKKRRKKPLLSIQVAPEDSAPDPFRASSNELLQANEEGDHFSGAWWRNTGYQLPGSSFLGAHSTFEQSEGSTEPSLFGAVGIASTGTKHGTVNDTDIESEWGTPRSRLQQMFGGNYVGEVKSFSNGSERSSRKRRRSSSTDSDSSLSHITKHPKDTRSNPFSASNPPLFHYSSCSRTGKRSQNEDRYAVVASACSTSVSTMYALFDGHGGSISADYCANNICDLIEKNLFREINILSVCSSAQEALDTMIERWNWFEVGKDGITSASYYTRNLGPLDIRYIKEVTIQRILLEIAMRSAFQQAHAALRQLNDPNQPGTLKDQSHDGTTALCCLIVHPKMRPGGVEQSAVIDRMLDYAVGSSDKFYPVSACDASALEENLYLLCLAHVGDTRAILIGNDSSIRQLTYDHRPDASSERTRVVARGHQIIDGRLNGKLAMSRSLGDEALGDAVCCDPDFLALLFNPSEERTLVLATDGLWTTMAPDEVARVTFDKEATFDALGDSLEWRKQLYTNTFSSSFNATHSSENIYANPRDCSYHKLEEQGLDRTTPILDQPAENTVLEQQKTSTKSTAGSRLDSRTVSERLVAEALLRGTTDDVTVLVVDLHSRKISRSSASSNSSASKV